MRAELLDVPHDAAPDNRGAAAPMAIVDSHGSLVAANDALERLLGGEAAPGRRIEDAVHPADRGPLRSAVEAAGQGVAVGPVRARLRRPAHRAGRGEVVLRPRPLPAHRSRRGPQLVLVEGEPRAADPDWKDALAGAPLPTAVVDGRWRVVSWNRAAAALLGWGEEDVVRQQLWLIVPEEGRPALARDLRRSRADGRWQGEVEAQNRNGRSFPVELALAWWEGEKPFATAVLRPLEADPDTVPPIVEDGGSSLHDPITGLAGPALFLDRVGHALARLDRRPGALAVLLVDLAGLRESGSGGGEGGDAALAELAGRLEGQVRPSDTVARLGATRFAVLCEDLAGRGDARAVGRRLAGAAREPLEAEGPAVAVVATIGGALADRPGRFPDEVLGEAGAALAGARARGPGAVEITGGSSPPRDVARLETERVLHRALEEGRLQVVVR